MQPGEMQHFNTTPLVEIQPGEMQFGEMQLSQIFGCGAFRQVAFRQFFEIMWRIKKCGISPGCISPN